MDTAQEAHWTGARRGQFHLSSEVRLALQARADPKENNVPTHPTIELFQSGAELLDLQGSTRGLDDAIAQLAAWMDLAASRLFEDDVVVLSEIGATLYREGLRNRR